MVLKLHQLLSLTLPPFAPLPCLPPPCGSSSGENQTFLSAALANTKRQVSWRVLLGLEAGRHMSTLFLQLMQISDGLAGTRCCNAMAKLGHVPWRDVSCESRPVWKQMPLTGVAYVQLVAGVVCFVLLLLLLWSLLCHPFALRLV